MTTDKNLLAAIRELIEAEEEDWKIVVGKFPVLASAEAIKAMEEIIKAFEIDVTPDEVFQHWQARIDFLKKQVTPE